METCIVLYVTCSLNDGPACQAVSELHVFTVGARVSQTDIWRLATLPPPPIQNFCAELLGVWMTNSFVLGSNVAMVSRSGRGGVRG